MHRRSLLLSAAALGVGACAAPAEAPAVEPPAPSPEPTPTAGGDFDLALYHAVAATPGNQFISPYSVASAFALVYPGAGGQTAAEIAQVFGFDASPATEAQQTRALADALRSQAGTSELNIANAAWVERSMALRDAYARTIRDVMGGTIEPVDFIRNQREALRQINAWAARETRNRIPQILTREDSSRRLVLTNAIYFKGRWADPFTASGTRDGDFHVDAQTRVRARLMRQITHARYIEAPGLQAARFDYDDGRFALDVFLPRERTGLGLVERSLTGARVSELMAQLTAAQPARLDVTLPKVQLNADYALGDTLQAMGVRTAFTSAADFSAITEAERLAISAVIHKTFLAIDEEGTEAAAVTAIDMVATAAPMDPPPPPIEFKADHPFFIVLHHKPTGARLFLGRIATVAA